MIMPKSLDPASTNRAEWVRHSILGDRLSLIALCQLLIKKGIIDTDELLSSLSEAGKFELSRHLLEHTDRDVMEGLPNYWYHAGGERATALMAELAGIGPFTEVLIVGSGMGNDARFLAKEFGCHVTGIDREFVPVYQSMLLTKTSGLADLVQFKIADARSMPLKTETVDVCWLQAVGLPLDIEPKVIAECYRILKPGGTYTIQERFKRDNLETEDYMDAFKTYLRGRGRMFGINEYGRILREAGFAVVSCETKYTTSFYVDHDQENERCRRLYENGDIVGAIFTARKIQ